mgnify:CR=1 FL=1
MSNQTILARPYAKAIFEIASHSGRQNEWIEILKELLQILQEPQVRFFLQNKMVLKRTHISHFCIDFTIYFTKNFSLFET